MQRLDCIIIGTGPAGLEAAVNLKIRGKRFLLIGPPDLSKKLTLAPKIDNYLGLHGISGRALADKCLAHLAAMEIEVHAGQVSLVYPMGAYFSVATASETFEATTIILATGVFSAKPLEGELEFLGRGVGYCATCDAPLYRGKTVAIIGYSGESVHEAEFVAEIAEKVYYIPVGKIERKPNEKVEIVNGRPLAVFGDKKAAGVRLDTATLEADGVFVLRDSIAPASMVPGIETENGFIKVDAAMRTNIAGLFAAGDCTGRPHQYMRAAGQGQTAALEAVSYMDNLKNKE